jgi:hypothetical protein
MGGLAYLLSEDQGKRVVLALVQHAYTSVEIILAEKPKKLLALIKSKDLKAGTQVAFRKRLKELQVHVLLHFSLLLIIFDLIKCNKIEQVNLTCKLVF